MSIILVVVFFSFVLCSSEYQEQFEKFKEDYGKTYSSEDEEALRYKLFVVNLRRAEVIGKRNPEATFGVNKFSDLSPAEMRSRKGYIRGTTNNDSPRFEIDVKDPPDNFDWRDKGMVSSVKNQADCGSCWAFSATGCMESVWAIKNGTVTDLSEQQLVDCDDQSEGCDGGRTDWAFQYVIKKAHGMETEADYPYTAQTGSCRFNPSKILANFSSYKTLPDKQEDNMLSVLFSSGPLAVAMDASGLDNYQSGILTHPNCGSTEWDQNHAVLAVGYGVSNDGTKYWTVKNSWGEDWGEQGYFQIIRGENACAIAIEPNIIFV